MSNAVGIPMEPKIVAQRRGSGQGSGQGSTVLTVQQAAANAIENNKKLFGPFSRKLSQGDLVSYTSFADKFATWLSDERAYYSEARPEILRILLIAHATLRRSVGSDPQSPFHISPHIGHPMVAPYSRLLQAIYPYRQRFIEPDLRAQLKLLFRTITAPSPALNGVVIDSTRDENLPDTNVPAIPPSLSSPSQFLSPQARAPSLADTTAPHSPFFITHFQSLPSPVSVQSAPSPFPSRVVTTGQYPPPILPALFHDDGPHEKVFGNDASPVVDEGILVKSVHAPPLPRRAALSTFHNSWPTDHPNSLEASGVIPIPAPSANVPREPSIPSKPKKRKKKLEVGLESLILADIKQLRKRGAVSVNQEAKDDADISTSYVNKVQYAPGTQSKELVTTDGSLLHSAQSHSPDGVRRMVAIKADAQNNSPPLFVTSEVPAIAFEDAVATNPSNITGAMNIDSWQTKSRTPNEQPPDEPTALGHMEIASVTNLIPDKQIPGGNARMTVDMEIAQMDKFALPTTSSISAEAITSAEDQNTIGVDHLAIIEQQDMFPDTRTRSEIMERTAETHFTGMTEKTKMSGTAITEPGHSSSPSIDVVSQSLDSCTPTPPFDHTSQDIIGTGGLNLVEYNVSLLNSIEPRQEFRAPTQVTASTDLLSIQDTPVSGHVIPNNSISQATFSDSCLMNNIWTSEILSTEIEKPVNTPLVSPDPFLDHFVRNIATDPEPEPTGLAETKDIEKSLQPGTKRSDAENSMYLIPAVHPVVEDKRALHEFGLESCVLVKEQGQTKTCTLKFHINILERDYTGIRRWNNRKNNSKDLTHSICYTLSCYPAAKTPEQFAVLPSTWPTSGDLCMRVMFMGKRTRFSLSPPLELSPNGMVDLSEFLSPGPNLLEIIQPYDASEYRFVVRAHHPTRAQLQHAAERRRKDQDWRNWLLQMSQPLDVLIPVFS